MNIVDLVKSQIGGDVLGKLAGTLGIGQDTTKSVVNGSIPTLLAGLSSVASTNDGAKKLNSMVESADDGLLSNVGKLFSGDTSATAERGSGMLTSLFGGSMMSSIGGALSKFTGLGASSITSLLGFLTPLILGILKGKKREMGLDTGAFASMLAGQKQNIANALPSGLGGMLAGIPGLSSLADMGKSAAGAVQSAGRTVAAGAETALNATAKTGGSALRWLLPIAAVALVGFLIWKMVGDRSSGTQLPSVDAKNASTDQVNRLTGQANDLFTSATTTITSIKDAETAEAALPKLKDLTGRVDALKGSLDLAPTEVKSKISSLVKDSSTKLVQLIEKTMTLPGVADKIKPVADPLIAKLKSMVA